MSNVDGALGQTILPGLQAELTRLRDSVVTGWQAFQAWSTWFHGIQAVVLGWIMAKADQLPSAQNVRVLASVAIALNLLALYGTLRLRYFVALQTKRAATICKHMIQYTPVSDLNIEMTSGFPSSLFLISGSMTIVVCAIAIGIWLYLF